MNTVQANTGNCFNNSDFKCKYNNQLKQCIYVAVGRVDMRLEINIIVINYEDFVYNINAYVCHFRAVIYKTKLTGLALLRTNVILPRLCFQRTPRSSAEQRPCLRNCKLRIRESESRFLLIKEKIKFNLRICTEFQM
jgi:hypothetical protein